MRVTSEFVKVYNHIFNYIHYKYGAEAYNDFLKALAPVVLHDLDELVKKEGIAGCLIYWGCICQDEGIPRNVLFSGDIIEYTFKRCPSRESLSNENRCNYCHHCEVIYSEILGKYGMEFKIFPPMEEPAVCQFIITQKPSSLGQEDTQNLSSPPSSEQTSR